MTAFKHLTRLCGVVTVAILATGLALAVDPAIARLPGYVDGAPFLDLAGEGGELVEVSLPGKILSIFCGKLAKEEPDVADVACGLDWIGAVIVGFEEDSTKKAEARKLIDRTEKKLLGAGWERLARVQEDGEIVKVLMLTAGQRISGLVVLVAEDDEVVFANVAGEIDMEQLSRLADKMDIPGLDDLPTD